MKSPRWFWDGRWHSQGPKYKRACAGPARCKAQLGPDFILHLRPPPAPLIEKGPCPRPSSSLLHRFPLRASQGQGCCLRALGSTRPLGPGPPPSPGPAPPHPWLLCSLLQCRYFCSLTSTICPFSPMSSSPTSRELFPKHVHVRGCLMFSGTPQTQARTPEAPLLQSHLCRWLQHKAHRALGWETSHLLRHPARATPSCPSTMVLLTTCFAPHHLACCLTFPFILSELCVLLDGSY